MSTIQGSNPTTPPAAPGTFNSNDPSQDAAAQAATDLGYMAYLARSYAALQAQLAGTTDPTQKAALQQQMNAILQLYNQIQGYYSVDASGNVTFTYTDPSGNTEQIELPNNKTNQQILADIVTMKGADTDITKYLAWSNSETNNPLLDVYEWLDNTGFTFCRANNDNTCESAIFFMMSLAGSPVGDLSGDVDQFLGQGDNNGAILPQSLILAQTLAAILAKKNDPVLTQAIEACLSITTKDTAYNALEAAFLAIIATPNWQVFYAGEPDWIYFEGRFWPYSPPGQATEHVFKANAVALSNRQLSDTSELTKMHGKEPAAPVQPVVKPKTEQ